MSNEMKISFLVNMNNARHLCNMGLLLNGNDEDVEIGGHMVADSLEYLIELAMDRLIDEDLGILAVFLKTKSTLLTKMMEEDHGRVPA